MHCYSNDLTGSLFGHIYQLFLCIISLIILPINAPHLNTSNILLCKQVRPPTRLDHVHLCRILDFNRSCGPSGTVIVASGRKGLSPTTILTLMSSYSIQGAMDLETLFARKYTGPVNNYGIACTCPTGLGHVTTCHPCPAP